MIVVYGLGLLHYTFFESAAHPSQAGRPTLSLRPTNTFVLRLGKERQSHFPSLLEEMFNL